MQIGIVTGNKIVWCGKSIPAAAIQKPATLAENRNWFKLVPGKINLEETEGTDILITGETYVVGKRHYPLQGYALRARLTSDFVLVPHLREAVGKETTVVKDENGIPSNIHWPVIVKNPLHKISNTPAPPLIQEALQKENITETTNLEDMAAAMCSSEPPEDLPFDEGW